MLTWSKSSPSSDKNRSVGDLSGVSGSNSSSLESGELCCAPLSD